MKRRLTALLDRVAQNRLRGWLRGSGRAARSGTGAEDGADAAGGGSESESDAEDAAPPPRAPGELIGLGLAMCVALSFVTLIVLLVAPVSSGCGSRQVSGPSAAAPAAPAPEAAPAAPAAPAEPDATTTAAPAAAPAAPPPSSLVGDYECRFTRANRELAPVPCAIRAGDDGALRMEQPGGAVRLTGTVTEDEAGFRLNGEVTCASGPCPGPGGRDLLFFNQGPGAYSAVLLIKGGRFLNIDIIRKD